MLFGDQHYGAAIDCWSAGLVLAELAGCRFHRSAASLAEATPLAHAKMLCRFFGLPPVTNLRTKPQEFDAAQGTPQWPPATLASLGQTGRHLLDGCLTWSASARWCARAALDSPFLTPERFVLGGRTADAVQASCSTSGGGPQSGVCSCAGLMCLGVLDHNVSRKQADAP